LGAFFSFVISLKKTKELKTEHTFEYMAGTVESKFGKRIKRDMKKREESMKEALEIVRNRKKKV
jgi:hypothetical protein